MIPTQSYTTDLYFYDFILLILSVDLAFLLKYALLVQRFLNNSLSRNDPYTILHNRFIFL